MAPVWPCACVCVFNTSVQHMSMSTSDCGCLWLQAFLLIWPHSDLCIGNPFAPGGGSGANAGSAPPMPGSAASSWGTGQDAAGPPPSASANEFETSPSGRFVQPPPFPVSSPPSAGAQAGAVPGGALEDESDSCVVCMSAPVQAGFLHGDRCVTLYVLVDSCIMSKAEPHIIVWTLLCNLGLCTHPRHVQHMPSSHDRMQCMHYLLCYAAVI